MNLERLRKRASFQSPHERRQRGPLRQCGRLAAISLLCALAACSGKKESQFSADDEITGFAGAVAADEPRAALVGRDVLVAGGSAADAAAAMYFTLAVTYPQAAALGGSGVCLVYSPKANKAEALEFLPRQPRNPGPVTLPANVRGFAALQARHGRLRWAAVVSPAEQLALFGAATTRATVRALDALDVDDLAKPAAEPFLRGADILPEGESVKLPDLGSTLSKLRIGGANEFYTGSLARPLVEGAREVGGTLTLDDLRQVTPAWRDAIIFQVDSTTLAVAPGPAGDVFQKIWQGTVTSGLRFISSASFQRENLLEAIGKAYGGLSGGERMSSQASTSFSAVDAYGLAVACGVGMQHPFGIGRAAGATGVVLAATPEREGDEARFLATVVAYNTVNKQAFAAATATGALAAPAALAQVAGLAIAANRPLEQALAEPRILRAGPQAAVLSEPKVAPSLLRGATAAEVSEIGRVNFVYCPSGVPRAPESCRAASDPRGYGVGQIGTK